MKKPVALVILDGWGVNKAEVGNAIEHANTPNFDRYMATYPNTKVAASGLDVGLPDGQMGNSEVGHLNIGAGRVVYQELTRITKSIKDGDFFENESLVKAMDNALIENRSLHVMGLLSDGGVHSHINHLKGLVDMAKKKGLNNIYVHAFLDGRDTPPRSAVQYIEELEAHMASVGIGEIATVSGRYYAMDRDKRWERVELAYNAIVKSEGQTAQSAVEAVESSYEKGENDEFVLPTVILKDGKATGQLRENDSVIFFNFRPDRARELTRALVDVEFDGFARERFDLEYVCLTQYDVTIEGVSVAFKPQTITNTLGEYVSAQGLNQLRIAETEKYAHVTFFFNGGVEEANPGEDRALIPSPKVATYDLQPEMSAYEVTDTLLAKLDEDKYDFIVLNFANPDMVGHTGVFDAAVKAVEVIDDCFAKVCDKIVNMGGQVIITADHGNAETMVDPVTQKPMTAHTTNVVPCILAGAGDVSLRTDGKLCDFAPTLLQLLKLEQPAEMTGTSLIK
ncbi:2,3-bisphosphoglycerate-independent phosphoglycerate mutase [Fusibacter sp. JL216-2]|uniref:2,3-bisphosphoglycerate-independent phosphoglycerate mutase n=1 Tax=Fusibacter sp. JL216-2 TaxID=3071453 RepID=UPI003D341E4F